MLVAKIETPDGISHLDEILRASDAVMVARGDLGVRVPLEDVPHLQKQIIRTGVRLGLPVITATQMLESMINLPVPTRAEVTDVANAVLDGTSAVMLSAETAIGRYPVRVCETMARIVLRTEEDFDYLGWGSHLDPQEVAGDASAPAHVTAAITGAGWRAALEMDAAAIVACTRSGATARAISTLPAADAHRRGDDLPAGAASAGAELGGRDRHRRQLGLDRRRHPPGGRGDRRGRRRRVGRRRRRARRLAALGGRRLEHARGRPRPLRRCAKSPPPRRELSGGADSTPRLTPRIVRARPSGRQPGGSLERPSVRECPGAAHGGDPQRSFGARVLGTRRSADRRIGRVDPKLRCCVR